MKRLVRIYHFLVEDAVIPTVFACCFFIAIIVSIQQESFWLASTIPLFILVPASIYFKEGKFVPHTTIAGLVFLILFYLGHFTFHLSDMPY